MGTLVFEHEPGPLGKLLDTTAVVLHQEPLKWSVKSIGRCGQP
jgi:hypothetical protein